jgi:hypothetical protein
MSKQAMITEINTIVDLNASLLTAVNLDIARFKPNDSVPIKEIPVTIVKESYSWFMERVTPALHELRQARDLLPERIWKTFALFGEDFKDHQEVRLLNAKRECVRRVITSASRPLLFKKGDLHHAIKVSKSKTTKSSGTDAATAECAPESSTPTESNGQS